MMRSHPKGISPRVRPSSLRIREKSQRFQPQVQVKLLNLGMRPKSEMEISPNVLTIPRVKPIGHGNARAARHREMIQERKQASTGCTYCFNNPRLQKSSLNHSSANCRQDPANGFKQKGSNANQASLKAAIRDVLNEPPDTNRSRDNKEEDGEYEPGRPLGSRPDDFEMDSEDSEKAARRKRRAGKK